MHGHLEYSFLDNRIRDCLTFLSNNYVVMNYFHFVKRAINSLISLSARGHACPTCKFCALAFPRQHGRTRRATPKAPLTTQAKRKETLDTKKKRRRSAQEKGDPFARRAAERSKLKNLKILYFLMLFSR